VVDVGRVSIASIALTSALSRFVATVRAIPMEPQGNAYSNERHHGAFSCMAPQEHVVTDMILSLHPLSDSPTRANQQPCS